MQALLDLVLADPFSHDARLVAADWLEERSDPWCELIRLQCELESMQWHEPGFAEKARRERDLLDTLSKRILAACPQRPPGVRFLIRNGFPSELRCHWGSLISELDNIFHAHPTLDSIVASKYFRPAMAFDAVERLTPLQSRLRKLVLSASPTPNRILNLFNEEWPQLEELSVTISLDSPKGWSQIRSVQQAKRLRLRLTGDVPTDDVRLPNVEELWLSFHDIECLRMLQLDAFPRLHALHLAPEAAFHGFRSQAVAAIQSASAALEVVSVTGAFSMVDLVLRSPLCASVQHLDLSSCWTHFELLQELKEPRLLPALRTLCFAGRYRTVTDVRDFLELERQRGLRFNAGSSALHRMLANEGCKSIVPIVQRRGTGNPEDNDDGFF